MFKLLSGILSRNGDRKDRSLVRGRSARHPWSLVRMLGRYDAATTTIDNVRHWAAADGLSASAANSPEVRRTLRNRSRYEIANNSYARGISLTLANDCVGTGPRLQMLTADAFANRFVEQEFFAWTDAIGLAEKLRTMRLARVSDGETFGLLTSKSTAKRQMPETDEEFQARLTEWYSRPEAFHREFIYLSEDRLAMLQDEVWEITQQYLDARRRGKWLLNTSNCFSYQRPCEYLAYCQSGFNPNVADNLYEIALPNEELSRVDSEAPPF